MEVSGYLGVSGYWVRSSNNDAGLDTLPSLETGYHLSLGQYRDPEPKDSGSTLSRVVSKLIPFGLAMFAPRAAQHMYCDKSHSIDSLKPGVSSHP